MTILIPESLGEKPGLLPTPPVRYSIGMVWNNSHQPNNKPPVSVPRPVADPLESKGVVCVDRQVVERGEKVMMLPRKIVLPQEEVECKVKNSFVEFLSSPRSIKPQQQRTRCMSCPDDMSKFMLPSEEPNLDEVEPQAFITTYMIRNIPTRFTSITFVRLLEDYGFRSKFNFLYIPIDFRSGKNLGYAFINFYDPTDGIAFVEKFNSRRLPVSTSKKILEILPSRRQGFEENISLFRTSDLLSSVSLPHYKPLVATERTGGQLVPLSDITFAMIV
jgi:hypothetical protein